MSEEWRPIVGFGAGFYMVSDIGRVKSLDRVDRSGKRRNGRVLADKASGIYGHRAFDLYVDRLKRRAYVHALVLEAFVGPRPDGFHGCHNDGDPTNNRLVNLRWDTPSANRLDSVRHGTHAMARKTECPRGHEYSLSNTVINANGGRECLVCTRARNRKAMTAYRAKMKEKSNA